MTVAEAYKKEIDLDYVAELAEESDYWETSDKFLGDVWEEDIEKMSKKQIMWLDKIAAGLEREFEKSQR